jgi:hypothetical protein
MIRVIDDIDDNVKTFSSNQTIITSMPQSNHTLKSIPQISPRPRTRRSSIQNYMPRINPSPRRNFRQNSMPRTSPRTINRSKRRVHRTTINQEIMLGFESKNIDNQYELKECNVSDQSNIKKPTNDIYSVNSIYLKLKIFFS